MNLIRKILFQIVALWIFLWSAPAFADGPYYDGGHMMGGGFMGWTMLIFWGLLLLILVGLVRWILGLPRSGVHERTPLETLQQRLANGEIDIEEFREKKQYL